MPQGRIWMACLALLALGGAACHSSPKGPTRDRAAQASGMACYRNARFGYSVAYPGDRLRPAKPPQNGDGRTFRSAGDRTVMTVYGRHNIGDLSPAALYRKRQANRAATQLTYQHVAGWGFVWSGYRGDRVVYEKAVLRDGKVLTLKLRYPRSRQSQFDPLVARIARSFPSANDAC